MTGRGDVCQLGLHTDPRLARILMPTMLLASDDCDVCADIQPFSIHPAMLAAHDAVVLQTAEYLVADSIFTW